MIIISIHFQILIEVKKVLIYSLLKLKKFKYT